MFNILKFKDSEESKCFWISDLHYHHEKLLESRGFSNIDEHNKIIIDNWNGKVTNNDIVFMLGDLVLGAGQDSQKVYEYLLRILNYRDLYLMQGNHFAGGKQIWDRYFKPTGYGEIDKYYRFTFHIDNNLSKTIHFIPNYYEVIVNRQFIVLCHYPILSWNNIRKGSWMLFGHCHNNLEKTDWIKKNYLTTKCMDVGFEAIKAPISFDEIKEIMDKRPIIEVDHH